MEKSPHGVRRKRRKISNQTEGGGIRFRRGKFISLPPPPTLSLISFFSSPFSNISRCGDTRHMGNSATPVSFLWFDFFAWWRQMRGRRRRKRKRRKGIHGSAKKKGNNAGIKKTLRTKVFGIMEKIQIEVLVSFSFAMLCLWWKAYCTFWAAFCVRTLLGLGEKGKGGGGKERGRQRLMEPS